MVLQAVSSMVVLYTFGVIGAFVNADTCPTKCKCTEATGTVNCTGAGLTVVPTIPSYAKKIILSMNSITEIKDKAFASASSTNYIDLRHNSISKISGFAFAGISQLQTLYLNQNELTDDVDLTSLSECKLLSDVYISFNHLTKIPAIQSGSLRKLVLDGNNILSAKFPEAYKINSLLQSVVLSHNAIRTISSTDFSNLLSGVKSLDMKLNSITEIDSAALAPISSHLETLNLDDNQLTEDDVVQTLNGLGQNGIPALLVLSLNRNKITKIDKKLFQSLHDGLLRNLQMDSNIITSIDPSAFAPVSETLKLLSLRKCGLSEISFDVSKFVNLIQLAVDGNHLKSLPSLLPLTLERLTAAKNKISGWQNTTFNGLTSLRALDLSSNMLRVIDNAALNTSLGVTLPSSTSLQQLNLDKNPFNCTCDLAKFLKWAKVKENTKKISNFKKYQCVSPAKERGTFLLNFDVSKCNTSSIQNLLNMNLLSRILDKLSSDRRVVVEIKSVSMKRLDIVYLFLMVIAVMCCYLLVKILIKHKIKKSLVLRRQSQYVPISEDVSVKDP